MNVGAADQALPRELRVVGNVVPPEDATRCRKAWRVTAQPQGALLQDFRL